MWRSLVKLLRARDGAIAPTIALSLTGLVAVGGIAFDYSRVASMDTEIQSAADQAALAAATQLDGEDGAQARARAAARNLIANQTYFANDGVGTAVDIPEAKITFYSDYDPVSGGKTAADGDGDSNYVQVVIDTRRANYALTPIVAALNSGNMTARAFATLDSAYCNLPPFMMCAPANFDPAGHIGAGLHLVIGQPNTPGNFGFLQTGFGAGANNLAKAIGWDGSAGGCVAARGAITEPGDKASVRSAVNTRFDMSEGGQTCPDHDDGTAGTCSPSTNARKDLVHATASDCSSSGNKGWSETDKPYMPTSTTPLTTNYPDVMGQPPDICHSVNPNTCGIVGNGVWDRDAYFRVNYGWDHTQWMTNTGLSATATRYQVYLWEAANPTPTGTTGGIGKRQGPFQVSNGNGKAKTTKFTDSQPVCRPPGVAPGDFDTDRRVTSVAVINCSGSDPNGRDTVTPVGWIDVFLVEPSFRRKRGTNGDEVYAEIIRTRPLPGPNQSIGNVIRRDVPRLIE